jgi:hypothetical protein
VLSDATHRATRAKQLFIAAGRQVGLTGAYYAFCRAAELEDCSQSLRSAAWATVGRTIIVALSLPRQPGAEENQRLAEAFLGPSLTSVNEPAALAAELGSFAAMPALQQHATHIANTLGVLLEAGREGGSISSESVYGLARNLAGDIGALMLGFDRVVSPGATRDAGRLR